MPEEDEEAREIWDVVNDFKAHFGRDSTKDTPIPAGSVLEVEKASHAADANQAPEGIQGAFLSEPHDNDHAKFTYDSEYCWCLFSTLRKNAKQREPRLNQSE